MTRESSTRASSNSVTRVIETARQCGYLAHHQRPGKQVRSDGTIRTASQLEGDKGIPDVILVNKCTGRIVMIEVKHGKHARLSPEQREWLRALGPAGVLLHTVIDPHRDSASWDDVYQALTLGAEENPCACKGCSFQRVLSLETRLRQGLGTTR